LDRLRGAGFVRLARLEDAAALLPGKVVERVRLGGLRLGRGLRGGRLGLGGRGVHGLSLLGLRLLGRLGFLGALVAHARRVSFSTSIPRWRATVTKRATSRLA